MTFRCPRHITRRSLQSAPASRPACGVRRRRGHHGLQSGDVADGLENGVEGRDAVRPADDRLAIEREGPPGASSPSPLSPDPVITFPREQPHEVALTANLQPVAVVLDLVHPAGSRWRLVRAGRDAGRDVAVPAVGISCRHRRRLPTRNGVGELPQWSEGAFVRACVSCLCRTTTPTSTS
jgi:hypothetical protein